MDTVGSGQAPDPLAIFQALLPAVRAMAARHAPDDWPQFRPVLSLLSEPPAGPLAVLPLAACAAVGGAAEAAIPLAAAWRSFNLALRLLDDLQDQDRPAGLWARVGPARAFNYAAALYTLSHQILAEADWLADRYRAISQMLSQTSIRMLIGQDRDLRGETASFDDYWRAIEAKNGAAFAFVCAAGARCGTDDHGQVGACGTYGYHLGLLLQLFDDFQGLWEPEGEGDLARGRVTLPLLYGLAREHERREELHRLVVTGETGRHAATIREILDGAGAREFIIWAALEERKKASTALQALPDGAGTAALNAYIAAVFADVGELLPPE